VSSLTSAWGASKDFAVSNFNVPKLAAPWEHEISEKGAWVGQPSSTIREFDHRRQRRRLFVNSSFQLLMTAGLCAGLAGALYGFSTIYWGLTQPEKKGFNALVTGLSILIGLNLASSLKGYAQMMRWRFLSSGYRTLQDFELVMQCESQSKVFRLLWAGRTRGQMFPNKTQVLAFIWLLINVSLQIVTALVGLTYSIDISDDYVSTQRGNISVADLSEFYVSTSTDISISSQGAIAQNFGVTGQDYSNTTSYLGEYVGANEAYYQNADMTKYWYNFIDQSPDGKETIVSRRSLITNATCTSYEVVKGGYSGFDDPANVTNEVTWINAAGEEQIWTIDPTSIGGTTWMAFVGPAGHCGPRCAYVYALQAADNETVAKPRFWECLNQVSHVTNVDLYGSPDIFDMPDEQAYIMGGAIGYSGINLDVGVDGSFMQYRAYPRGTLWSPSGKVSELDMARILMEFSAGAIAALDFTGGRFNTTDQQQPIAAQIVNVEWKWAAIVLGVIPLTQGIVLILVVTWANKAVIKDTSFLATARLLRPIVEGLGDRGCLLTGDEIAEELGNYRVIYGPRFPAGAVAQGGEEAVVKHLDIIAQEENLEKWHGRMPAGRYDGMTTWGKGDVRGEEEVEGLMEGRERKSGETVRRRRMSL
jgi:hypothetical protein